MPVIELIGKAVDAYGSSQPPPGQIGHQLVFTEDLFDAFNRLVGQHSGFCFLVRPSPSGPHLYQCRGSFLLPEGQILGGGLIPITTTGVAPAGVPRAAAITGGSGKYGDATGQISIVTQGPNTWLYVLDVHGVTA